VRFPARCYKDIQLAREEQVLKFASRLPSTAEVAPQYGRVLACGGRKPDGGTPRNGRYASGAIAEARLGEVISRC
jgi:hypothetical protein